jgi:hypothetical protein
MDDVKIETSKTLTLTLPSDPTSNVVSVSLYHEFGSLVSGPTNATRSSAGVYTITYGQAASGIYVLNAAGRYRADFTYTVSGTSYTQSQYFNVYTPYIDIDTFFEDHPELETEWYDKFDKMEKKVRNIINTYCGQSFEYYPNKYLEVMGSGKNSLHLPNPITTLRKVTSDPGTNDETIIHDYSDATLNHIEKIREPHNFGSSYYIQFRKSVLDSVNVLLILNKFDRQSTYRVEGDFGWQFVPNNIEQAADLLLVDMMNDDSEFRRHGIQRVEMDTIRYEINTTNFFETTGNIDADVLLMDYTLFVMDYVV